MITVTFLNGCILATAAQSLWQYSYNQQCKIIGLELPEVFTVDFCNTGETSSVAMIGSNNVVDIPNELLVSGSGITAYVFQKSALTGGITRCEIRIDVLPRPERDDETPTPEQESVIDQLIVELNEGVEEAEGYATAAGESAEAATRNANDSEAWAVGERDGEPVEPSDPTYFNNAKHYALVAQQGADKAGYAFFNVDDSDGNMYVTITDNLAQDVTFFVNETIGELEVTVHG
jgi:hypothetical protein